MGEQAYSAYRACRFFRCFPEAGGLDQQNPALVDLILCCADWEARAERRFGSEHLAALVGMSGLRNLVG